jgi:hypothetical protein
MTPPVESLKPSPLVGEGAERHSREAGEGADMHLSAPPIVATPHPA